MKRKWNEPWRKNFYGRFIRGWIEINTQPINLNLPTTYYGIKFAKEMPVDISDSEFKYNDYIYGPGKWVVCHHPAQIAGTIHGLKYHTDEAEPIFVVNPICHF